MSYHATSQAYEYGGVYDDRIENASGDIRISIGHCLHLWDALFLMPSFLPLHFNIRKKVSGPAPRPTIHYSCAM
jgi:hypothetical protein